MSHAEVYLSAFLIGIAIGVLLTLAWRRPIPVAGLRQYDETPKMGPRHPWRYRFWCAVAYLTLRGPQRIHDYADCKAHDAFDPDIREHIRRLCEDEFYRAPTLIRFDDHPSAQQLHVSQSGNIIRLGARRPPRGVA